MAEKDLDTRFQEAVEIAETIPQASLPQDMQLRLYAYFKQATSESSSNQHYSNIDLRSAFKTNALMQISHLSSDEAKELYIENIMSLKNKK
jgi:acyl-CoA-binding protein